jgi:hypothetical protein
MARAPAKQTAEKIRKRVLSPRANRPRDRYQREQDHNQAGPEVKLLSELFGHGEIIAERREFVKTRS